jgi:hypothetical protein
MIDPLSMDVPQALGAMDAAFDTYLALAREAALDLLRAQVWPVFRRRGYLLESINGDYWILDRDGLRVDRPGTLGNRTRARTLPDGDEEMIRVYAVLDVEIPGTNEVVGAFGHMYPEQDPT